MLLHRSYVEKKTNLRFYFSVYRGNNLNKDDADGLRYALVHIPNLEVLDMSDNPIEDDGIRLVVF